MKISAKFKSALLLLTSAVGGTSSLLSLFTTSFGNVNLALGIGIIVLTVIAVLIITYFIPKDNLPEDMEEIINEMEKDALPKNAKVIFPCDAKYYQAANKLAKEKFGKNSVSTSKVNDWKKRNELILTCLTDHNRFVGYFDMIPLKEDFALKFIEGDLGEQDICAENILGVHEMKDARFLYFAGIAVQDSTGCGCFHATYLLWAAALYINLFYGDSKLEKILTIPTSKSGLNMTKRMNFSLEQESKLRKDGLDLYSKPFQKLEMQDLITNKNNYNRFDVSSYHQMLQKINGSKADSFQIS